MYKLYKVYGEKRRKDAGTSAGAPPDPAAIDEESSVSISESPATPGKTAPGGSGVARNVAKSSEDKHLPGTIANRNATRHGLRSELNRLPPGCSQVRRQRDRLRRFLEEAVIESAGHIDIAAAARIQTCCRWAAHAALAARWLRTQYDELSLDQRLHFSREVCRASGERDRCLDRLNLDRDHDDVLTALYAGPPPTPDETATEGQQSDEERSPDPMADEVTHD